MMHSNNIKVSSKLRIPGWNVVTLKTKQDVLDLAHKVNSIFFHYAIGDGVLVDMFPFGWDDEREDKVPVMSLGFINNKTFEVEYGQIFVNESYLYEKGDVFKFDENDNIVFDESQRINFIHAEYKSFYVDYYMDGEGECDDYKDELKKLKKSFPGFKVKKQFAKFLKNGDVGDYEGIGRVFIKQTTMEFELPKNSYRTFISNEYCHAEQNDNLEADGMSYGAAIGKILDYIYSLPVNSDSDVDTDDAENMANFVNNLTDSYGIYYDNYSFEIIDKSKGYAFITIEDGCSDNDFENWDEDQLYYQTFYKDLKEFENFIKTTHYED